MTSQERRKSRKAKHDFSAVVHTPTQYLRRTVALSHFFSKYITKKVFSRIENTYIYSLDCQSRQRLYWEGHSLCIPSIKPSFRNLHQSIHVNVDTFTSNEIKTLFQKVRKCNLRKCLVKSISCFSWTKFLRSQKKIIWAEVTCEMFTEFITLNARLMKAARLKMRKNPWHLWKKSRTRSSSADDLSF